MSEVITTIVETFDPQHDNWQSFSIVIGLSDEGEVSSNSGYTYDSTGQFTSIVADDFEFGPVLASYLSDIYGDTPFPVRMLLQFDRSTGQFKTLFEDKDTSRWSGCTENSLEMPTSKKAR
ncbi:MAG: hypothetical protein ACRBCL_04020 [Maritimibacter sp.]